jgi:hypothetical protein
MLTGENVNNWGTPFSNVTLSTKNPTCTGLAVNLVLCCKRLESSEPSDGMDVDLPGFSVLGMSINIVSQYCNEPPVITLLSLFGQNVAVENTESKSFHCYCSDDLQFLIFCCVV